MKYEWKGEPVVTPGFGTQVVITHYHPQLRDMLSHRRMIQIRPGSGYWCRFYAMAKQIKRCKNIEGEFVQAGIQRHPSKHDFVEIQFSFAEGGQK